MFLRETDEKKMGPLAKAELVLEMRVSCCRRHGLEPLPAFCPSPLGVSPRLESEQGNRIDQQREGKPFSSQP